jgi:ubiquitin C-terminal hydrolase
LKKKLVIEEDLSLQKNKDYYMFQKAVWEFFFNIYGGGPIIIMNKRNTQRPEYTDPKIEVQSMSSNFSKYGQSTATTSAYKDNNTMNRSANKS